MTTAARGLVLGALLLVSLGGTSEAEGVCKPNEVRSRDLCVAVCPVGQTQQQKADGRTSCAAPPPPSAECQPNEEKIHDGVCKAVCPVGQRLQQKSDGRRFCAP